MIAESILDLGAEEAAAYADDAAALVEQGIGWHRLGDADRAEIAYQRALLDDPANADVLRLLALVKADRDQRGKALRLLNAACRLALRSATVRAPLMDDDGYARAWTQATRDIWRRWCASGGAA